MGLYEGGLLLTMLMFLVSAGLYLAGAPVNENLFGNFSNEGNYRAATTGLSDINQGTFETTTTTGNITVSENQQKNSFDAIGAALGGGFESLPRIVTLIGFILTGWIQIVYLVLGGTPYFFLAFAVGLAFDIAKLYFLFHTFMLVVSVIRGGTAI